MNVHSSQPHEILAVQDVGALPLISFIHQFLLFSYAPYGRISLWTSMHYFVFLTVLGLGTVFFQDKKILKFQDIFFRK